VTSRDTIGPIETVLARYLGLRPSSVALQRSSAGKPESCGAYWRKEVFRSMIKLPRSICDVRQTAGDRKRELTGEELEELYRRLHESGP
jgi:hypothetical protein